MATRDRTLLFIQYRNSFLSNTRRPKNAQRSAFTDDRQGLLGDDSNVVEMSTLPPRWLDTVEEIRDEIESIKKKISQVEGMQKKSVLPGFADSNDDEATIESISADITNAFTNCQKKIKLIVQETNRSSSPQEKSMGKNVQISLATQLQELSTRFRKSQSAYLAKLRGRDAKGNEMLKNFVGITETDGPSAGVYNMGFQAQELATITSNEAAISEREKEINEIAKSIYQLAELFRDLQTMVIDQGTLLDRIDYNIETTVVTLENANKELVEGEKYQKKAQSKKCLIILALIIAILLIIVLFKPRK